MYTLLIILHRDRFAEPRETSSPVHCLRLGINKSIALGYGRFHGNAEPIRCDCSKVETRLPEGSSSNPRIFNEQKYPIHSQSLNKPSLPGLPQMLSCKLLLRRSSDLSCHHSLRAHLIPRVNLFVCIFVKRCDYI